MTKHWERLLYLTLKVSDDGDDGDDGGENGFFWKI